MKRVCILVMAVLFPALSFGDFVDYVDVYEADNLSVSASWNQQTGVLSWTAGKRALLRTEEGTTDYLFGTMSASFSGITDLSSGGTANAKFDEGNFRLDFYRDPSKTLYAGYMTGTLWTNWQYWERETSENPSELYGSSLIRIQSFWVDADGDGNQDREWIEGINSMGGLTCTTKNLTPQTISGYQSGWTSPNALVTIIADESGIPEPATLVLLGLGSLSLLKRRK